MAGKEELNRVAENARLDVSGEEADQILEDFEEILEMFDRIDKIDTDDVEPAFHPVEVEPEIREDIAEDCLDEEGVFRNTDNVEEKQFKGPKV